MEDDLRTLPDALSVIRRRWLTVVAFVLLGVLAGVALSLLQTPQYTATATLLVRSPASQSTGSRALDPEEVATQAEVVVSDEVASRVIKDLSLDTTETDLVKQVDPVPQSDSQTIDVAVTSSSADQAAKIANAFATRYKTVGEERTQAAQQQVADFYVGQLSDVRGQLRKLRDKLAGASSTEITALQAQIDGLTARQTQLETSLIQANDPTTLIPQADVIHKATTPGSPSSPNALRSGLLGGVVGLVIGLLIAFVRERLDDVVRDGSTAEALLDAPLLGHVPRFDSSSQGRVVSLVSPFSPAAEAYRVLNANVRFLLAAHPHDGAAVRRGARTVSGSVMVASAAPTEGKTSLATNLAVTAARSGVRVVLVEADLRNPSIGRLFGLDAPRGLSDLLIEGGDTTDYLLDVGVENLLVLPAGSVPPNPAELLSSAQAHELWLELRALADLVIFDTPPLLRVADGLDVATYVDAVVVTARHGVTRTHQLEAVAGRLSQIAGERSVGIVLNAEPGSKQEHIYGYGQRPTVEV
jgi:capsular exopolysaccharide synthesis family protein